jgi:hypothetical protein
MVKESVRALNEYVNLDDARPVYSEEEIVEFIFRAMAQRQGGESSSEGS